MPCSEGSLLSLQAAFLDGRVDRAQFEDAHVSAVKGELTDEMVERLIAANSPADPAGPRFTEAHLKGLRAVWDRLVRPVYGLTFDRYLRGSDGFDAPPPVPRWPFDAVVRFKRDVFVEGRVVEKIGIREACRLLGVSCEIESPEGYRPLRPEAAAHGARWMRATPQGVPVFGWPRAVRDYACQDGCAGLDLAEGLFALVDDGDLAKAAALDIVLAGAVDDSDRLPLLKHTSEFGAHSDDLTEVSPQWQELRRGRSDCHMNGVHWLVALRAA